MTPARKPAWHAKLRQAHLRNRLACVLTLTNCLHDPSPFCEGWAKALHAAERRGKPRFPKPPENWRQPVSARDISEAAALAGKGSFVWRLIRDYRALARARR